MTKISIFLIAVMAFIVSGIIVSIQISYSTSVLDQFRNNTIQSNTTSEFGNATQSSVTGKVDAPNALIQSPLNKLFK